MWRKVNVSSEWKERINNFPLCQDNRENKSERDQTVLKTRENNCSAPFKCVALWVHFKNIKSALWLAASVQRQASQIKQINHQRSSGTSNVTDRVEQVTSSTSHRPVADWKRWIARTTFRKPHSSSAAAVSSSCVKWREGSPPPFCVYNNNISPADNTPR